MVLSNPMFQIKSKLLCILILNYVMFCMCLPIFCAYCDVCCNCLIAYFITWQVCTSKILSSIQMSQSYVIYLKFFIIYYFIFLWIYLFCCWFYLFVQSVPLKVWFLDTSSLLCFSNSFYNSLVLFSWTISTRSQSVF